MRILFLGDVVGNTGCSKILNNLLNRIGYGSGYYDRYIKKVKKNKKIILIGLAYSFQKVKKIPANKYDMKLDFIVTDKNFI